ncbi:MAG TPA: MFS transporter [Chloroflexi bacterium]|nr:MFS transporter [Chloroflexota bacterium]
MGSNSSHSNNPPLSNDKVPLLTKIIYGTGDWGMASFNTVRQIFYLIFLTDVVGLKPGLASFAVLAGIIWDAINDPIIGALSDRVKTRWGRRRPFLLIFAIPFGFAFVMLWWTPPWESQIALMIHVALAYMITDTLQTLITVPFLSLTPEMTEDYDERTSLTTFRMFFNLMASLAAAAGAPAIVDMAPTPQQGYLLMASIFGALGALPFLTMFFVTREREEHAELPTPEIRDSLKAAWNNKPFRIATAINVLNWVTFDLIGLMLPFFLTYWVEGGVQRSNMTIPVLGTLPFESVVFLVLMTTAIAALPIWTWLARHWNKRNAYIVGMLFWAVVQLLIITIQPGQRTYILTLTFLAGISVSTAHVLPEALFPDVVEWDELMTGRRREGTYYGLKTFIRKITSAGAIFLASQVLALSNYRSPTAQAAVFQQSPETLLAIRILTGPAGTVFLIGAIVTAFFYPVSREKHARMRRLLARQRAMQAKNHPISPAPKKAQ